MSKLQINIKHTLDFIKRDAIYSQHPIIKDILDSLYNKTGKGNDFLGWLDLPSKLPEDIINNIESTANKIKSKAEIFVVIGIGGSYLGARAVIEALSHHFGSMIGKNNFPQII